MKAIGGSLLKAIGGNYFSPAVDMNEGHWWLAAEGHW